MRNFFPPRIQDYIKEGQEKDMKGEANLAPVLSVGMGQHLGRGVRQDTLFSTKVQRSFVIVDDLHVHLGREAFVRTLQVNGLAYSNQMGCLGFQIMKEMWLLLQ